MKIILPLLLTLFLSTDTKQEDTRDTFQFACHYADIFYGVACGDLKPPIVVISQAVPIIYRGFYISGEPYIFIHPWYSLAAKRATIVHETMHYILDHKQTGVTRCESEEAARYVHSAWLDTPYNDDWRKRYDCEIGEVNDDS